MGCPLSAWSHLHFFVQRWDDGIVVAQLGLLGGGGSSSQRFTALPSTSQQQLGKLGQQQVGNNFNKRQALLLPVLREALTSKWVPFLLFSQGVRGWSRSLFCPCIGVLNPFSRGGMPCEWAECLMIECGRPEPPHVSVQAPTGVAAAAGEDAVLNPWLYDDAELELDPGITGMLDSDMQGEPVSSA